MVTFVVAVLVAAGIVTGLVLWLQGNPSAGVPVTLGTAVLGLVLFLLNRLSPASRVQQIKARRELDEIRETERQEQQRRRMAEALERRREAQIRDLDKIRRAIIIELGKLSPGTGLFFGWGPAMDGRSERRFYRLDEDRLLLEFSVRGTGTSWVWEEGNIPRRNDTNPELSQNPGSVDNAYRLIQPERYLVTKHLGEELELPDPGYAPHGVEVG